MINFRYHIVSLMAVFIALSVGIAVGVSLGPSVDQGLLRQAEQDRKQVAELRAELNRRNALDEYREAYDEQAGQPVIQGALNGVRVAVVTMPDAPGRVVTDISSAVAAAGGSVVREVQVRPAAFDPAKAAEVTKALGDLAVRVPVNDEMTQSEKIGAALARSIASPQVEDRDELAIDLGEALSSAGFVALNGGSAAQAQLVLVVAAEASDPPVTSTVLSSHVEFALALKARAGVVLAGPNSAQIEGTDVLAARTDPKGNSLLSTVDVADLSSGVVTTVLAGQEQLLGRVGQHYGALARAEAPLPKLPIR
jgi:Copper transport outer membrane protein, MctB